MIKSDNFVAAWLHFLETNAGLSSRTIKEYEKDMRYFVEWSAMFSTPLDIRFCSLVVLEGYVSWMNEQGLCAQTIKRRAAALRSFFRWLASRGIIQSSPAVDLVTPRAPYRLVNPADEQAVRSFLNRRPASKNQRLVWLAVAIMFSTGMRLSEVLSLRGADFDFELCTVRVIGKGNKERLCVFSSGAALRLNEFVGGSTELLFPDMKESTLRWAIINNVRAGDRGVNPHSIRHLFATRCLAAGMPLKTLSVILGHASVKTTERYTTISGHDLCGYGSALCPSF